MAPYVSATFSETIFGEISPKWEHFKSLWQLFESLLNIWQNVAPSLEIFPSYWAHCHSFKWSNIEKI